ncbi:FAD-binding domain-containing protein [Corynespora cassiicola Philippines]|uniref:FAD-binding domain-containing protein n=1 Tax=Corynespora cassiicola Philippines TaxID=1448308 RepID=A0A2T2PD17_CORCC|nr:FAD-binding domain-containing protein [Corynespora cassiicola Philippines]
MLLVTSLLLSSLLRPALGSELNTDRAENCKCLPSDECWPDQQSWDKLNSTVGGRLVQTVPLGSPCHDPNYDEEKCAQLQEDWLYSGVHLQSSSSVMAPLFANQSCDPFTPKEIPCTLGNYVSYAVNVSSSDDIAAALSFAREKNIRFVVRNTGHDYLGRSTGAGALAVWMQNLKETEIIDWKDETFEGKALKLGAGIQSHEALAAVKEENLVVVTGECPTVGLAGGYIQGGGHSALSTRFGLAADNVISFEVITTSGERLTASQTENSDLFWALSGGGPGTYAIVLSATIKAYPDAIVSGASFTIDPPEDQPELMNEIIDKWHAALPGIVDKGAMVIYYFSQAGLQVPALTAYNSSMGAIMKMLRPFGLALQDKGIRLNPSISQSASYHEHYEKHWGPLPEGNIQVGTMLFGGRLIPRDVIPTEEFSFTARQLMSMGVTFIGVGLDVASFGMRNSNAVLPQWRSSLVQASLVLPWSFDADWEDMLATQDAITEFVQPVIESVTPGAGAYMNEADFQQKDWKETFFGEKYGRLAEIKEKYDPEGLLWAVATVGSDKWSVASDGRMCKNVGSPGKEAKTEEVKEKAEEKEEKAEKDAEKDGEADKVAEKAEEKDEPRVKDEL